MINMDSRASSLIGESFRPDGIDHLEMPEEKWDLFVIPKERNKYLSLEVVLISN